MEKRSRVGVVLPLLRQGPTRVSCLGVLRRKLKGGTIREQFSISTSLAVRFANHSLAHRTLDAGGPTNTLRLSLDPLHVLPEGLLRLVIHQHLQATPTLLRQTPQHPRSLREARPPHLQWTTNAREIASCVDESLAEDTVPQSRLPDRICITCSLPHHPLE